MLRTRIIIVLVVAIATITAVVGVLFPPIDLPPPSAIEIPEAAILESAGADGAVVAAAAVGLEGLEPFMQFCSECHGEQAVGTDQGPPLVHQLYEPNHHADEAFIFAARRGSRQHHWNFGNMPPVTRVGDGDLVAIIGYVRTLQQAAGIF